VSEKIRRVDTPDKAAGRARFITDIAVAGMAHVKLWRSPVPHARLMSTDITRAARAPGVIAVARAEDLPVRDLYYGPAFKDQPLLAHRVVRFAGEPVVAVVAETAAQAEAATALVEVEWDELPLVATLDAALAPDAPLLHERLRPAAHFRDLATMRPIAGTNVCHHFHFERGDTERGLAEADLVVDDTFTFPMVHHCALEPHCAIARWDADGVTVWASTSLRSRGARSWPRCSASPSTRCG